MLFQEIVWASNFISAWNGGCLPFCFRKFHHGIEGYYSRNVEERPMMKCLTINDRFEPFLAVMSRMSDILPEVFQ